MPASESLVWEAMSELKEIFNVEEVPYPILTSYSSWNGEGDHGYGYHFWNVGVDDKNLEVTRPVKEKNLYICNEAWSSYQGFVEGSLKSAENVVDRIVNEI
jgi:monoamine oxidase